MIGVSIARLLLHPHCTGRIAAPGAILAGNVAFRLTSGARAQHLRWMLPRVLFGVLLVLAAWEWLQPQAPGSPAPGQDFAFYRDVAQRWLTTGAYYLPDQLAGPHQLTLMRDVLYPPTALYLFVPFVWLPAFLWWAIPLGVLGYAFWRWQPAAWTWPLLAFGLLWPRTQGAFLFGNTDMWIAAAIAAGFLWGWPAALVALKPIFLPFALAGAPRWAWWLGWAVCALVSLPMLPLWFDYLVTLRNAGIPWLYSLANVVLPAMPVVAWAGRQVTGTIPDTKPSPDVPPVV
jgi:hypothetical protein